MWRCVVQFYMTAKYGRREYIINNVVPLALLSSLLLILWSKTLYVPSEFWHENSDIYKYSVLDQCVLLLPVSSIP